MKFSRLAFNFLGLCVGAGYADKDVSSLHGLLRANDNAEPSTLDESSVPVVPSDQNFRNLDRKKKKKNRNDDDDDSGRKKNRNDDDDDSGKKKKNRSDDDDDSGRKKKKDIFKRKDDDDDSSGGGGGGGSGRLQMYCDPDFEWQNKRKCPDYCLTYKSCSPGATVEIRDCGGSSRQKWEGDGSSIRPSCSSSLSLDGNQLKKGSTSVGYKKSGKFEIKKDGKCLSNQHHPRDGEDVDWRNCYKARKTNTNLWHWD